MFTGGSVVAGVLWSVPAGLTAPRTPLSEPPRPVASRPSAEPTDEALYAQGRARLEAGDAATAIELLARAAARRPDNLDYALMLGKAHVAAGQPSAALELLRELAARQPGAMVPRVALAEVQALGGDWTAVKKVLSPLEDRLDADALVLLARAYARTGRPSRASEVLRRGLERRPGSETLWLALIDHALELQQCGLALQRVDQARRQLDPSPPLEFRAAQAYFGLGQVLGQTRVMRIRGGRAGQFVNGWLLVEARDEPDRFLCCPKASALHALRRALDAGLDQPAAHRLHARIWQQAGRPKVGLAILQSREAVWLEDASSEALGTFADVALAADALEDFLRYTRLRAAHQPQRRAEIVYEAYVAAAERYNQRGDETMYRELLRRALSLRPDEVGLMIRLGDVLWDAGAREEATVWYRRVLERQPAHQGRSRILKRLGE